MKFMDRVMTAMGPGNVIGRITDGSGLLVTIKREDVIGKQCLGPCLNLAVKWSQIEVGGNARGEHESAKKGAKGEHENAKEDAKEEE